MVKMKMKLVGTGVICSLVTGLATYFITSKKMKQRNTAFNSKENKFKQYYHLTNQWLLLKNEKKSVAYYLISMGYHKIAIYGMGELGNRLYEELVDNADLEISYAIDKYPESGFEDLKFCELSKDLDPVDVIIVTPVFDYEAIEKEINSNVNYAVISLEEMVFNC